MSPQPVLYMEILLLAFANDRIHPLSTLSDEYLSLNKTLTPRVLRGHYLAWSLSHAGLDDIAYYLSLFRERLSLFLYSGHADRDHLLTEGQESRSEGIVQLLKQCPRLKVVILNGCSTGAQVSALHEAGIPVVIASSAPVDDELATRFSKSLFQSLEAGLNIQEAFALAEGVALAVKPLNIYKRDRILDAAKENPEAPIWGLFVHERHADAANWKLPVKAVAAQQSRLPEPNERLLEVLYESLAENNPRVKELHDQGAVLENRKDDIVLALLKALPAPLSEQIRKLVAPSESGAKEGWDLYGAMRMEQLVLTYQICMDFMVFTLMAELWKHAMKSPPLASPVLQTEIKRFFYAQSEDFDYFSLVSSLRAALPEEAPDCFIEELDRLRQDFLEDERIKNACFFLETLRRQGPVQDFSEINERCYRAEEALADVFSRLGFLGRYILATVRNIGVHKYLHTESATFEHLIMKWHGSMGFYEKEYRTQPEFMDNRSVVLLRLGDVGKNMLFLNLSPFILDENTFEMVPDLSLSKLYFFARMEGERLIYKYVNDPASDIIDLDNQEFYDKRKKGSKFLLAKEQFSAFYQTFLSLAS